MHVADIMPTLLEVAGVQYPETREGRRLPPLVRQVLDPDARRRGPIQFVTDEDYLAWELFGNRAVRQGNWKLRWQWKPYGTGDWELFDLISDPGERQDLASKQPEKVVALGGALGRTMSQGIT